jgi:cell wall-associated NlpC family hydrolase
MMSRAGKIRAVAVTATAVVALSLPIAAANADSPPASAEATIEPWPAPTPPAPPPVEQGTTLAPPATTTPSVPSGGLPAGAGDGESGTPEVTGPEGSEEIAPGPDPSTILEIPSLPASSCAATGVPPVLVPIFRRAAATYGLGPQGPAVLAGINEVETAFGTNLNVSSAGALGWMQFMPSSWEAYGVDANGDGVRDPYNPEDAIFAAAGYLRAAGMPANTYDAIFAYNHADWYVSEVLANAGCYAKEVGGPSFDAAGLGPQIQVLQCTAGPNWKDQIPKSYMTAFEDAAARYDLGKRGVWALAAVARLESNFGKGMTRAQMRSAGPLGLDEFEWRQYGVDGNEDGHIRHAGSNDSAATLARMIWSRGSLRAGLFTHNQAEWYVQEILDEAEQIEGKCKVDYIEWAVAPLGNGFETAGENAVLLGNLASAPRSAPPAVKAAIAAANSISTTPYVWGGGHSSWYSYGYDCSGAVSFALYGAGLLDTPLTSGQLESYGEPGPGKWITIYASPTHTYAVIAGLRWDTVGNANGSGPRWHTEPPYPEGFVVRHPTGY